jgi:hypothetical protein
MGANAFMDSFGFACMASQPREESMRAISLDLVERGFMNHC